MRSLTDHKAEGLAWVEPAIYGEVVVPASVGAVWEAWTTEAGLTTFFAPEVRMQLIPGGPFEMLFLPAGEPQRGSEGCVVLAYQPEKMLSFTWNAPPQLNETRMQHTHVILRFHPLSDHETHVTLVHDGWGEGGQWDETFAYFESAWNAVILPRLRWRFVHGPYDWDARPPLE